MTESGSVRFPGRGGVLVALALAATGCTDSGPPAPTTTTRTSTTRPAPPTPPDAGLRPVRLAFRDGIAFVLPETAAQAICQGMPAAQWRDIVGGAVGRSIDAYSADGTCVVVSGWLHIDLSMAHRSMISMPTEDETIAGHRARFRVYSSGSVTAAAEVVPLDPDTDADPVLYVRARMEGLQDHPDLSGSVHRLLAALLPTLTPNAPATPVVDAPARLALTPTEPIPGVALVDLPPTVQSLVLCTAVVKTLRRAPPPEQIFVSSVGECSVEGPVRVFAQVNVFGGPSSGEFTIAGHTAHPIDHGVQIELLKFTSEALGPAWAELELTRRDLNPTQLRTWAEQVATPLLTT